MAGLKVGAGRAQINFKNEMLPTESFDGIHDLPHAGLVYVENGEKIVIVSMDLVMISEDLIERLKDEISTALEVEKDNIWIHVTHAISTPHAPGPMGPPDRRPDPTPRQIEQLEMFESAILDAVKEAAQQAAGHIVPAKMGTGSGECLLNKNRDVEFPAGWWINIGDGPSDHELRAVRFDDMEGKPVAILLNYDMKPCTIDNSEMDKGTRKICSDAPGWACSALSEKYGAPVLYFMAAAADQVPRDMALLEEVGDDGKAYRIDKGVAYGLDLVKNFAAELESAAKAVIDSVECTSDDPAVKVGSKEFNWQTKGRGSMTPLREAEWKSNGSINVDTNVILIGDNAFVGFRPEVCYATSKQLKELSPAANTLLFSMINGGFKYMPDESAYERVTWESQSAGLMPGAAEEFVKASCSLINELR